MTDKDDRPARKSGWLPQQVPLNEVQNPVLHKALALWNAKKADRNMPPRDDITPRDMADFLRNIVLVKVLDGGEFQFRIVGDAIVAVQGGTFQGMNTAEIERAVPGYGAALREVYSHLCSGREPLAFRGNSQSRATGRAFFHETFLLPLGADGETVDHILVITIYSYGKDGLKA